MTRREFFVAGAAAGAAVEMAQARLSAAFAAPAHVGGRRRPIKAIAFDAFPIFDPRPVFAAVEELFPGRGAELSGEWRTRQFEYTWLRTIMGRYADFAQVTEEALRFTARKLGLEVSDEARERLMGMYHGLGAWPDAGPALESLRGAGYRLVLLSNFTPAMLEGCIDRAGLGGVIERAISTDQARTFKPDPRAYQLGVERLGLAREEILFVAFAGWDAAGAAAFGYPTFWVNRMGMAREELGVGADGEGRGLGEVVGYLDTLK